ncbi:MAG: redoxin domain-containing protein [Myxococcota bacterium]
MQTRYLLKLLTPVTLAVPLLSLLYPLFQLPSPQEAAQEPPTWASTDSLEGLHTRLMGAQVQTHALVEVSSSPFPASPAVMIAQNTPDTPSAAPGSSETQPPPRPPSPPVALPEGKVGLKLFQRKGVCFVQEVVPGSPAEQAGILPGERLFAVNDESIEELGIKQITDLIKGTPGTPVRLSLRRPGGPPREVDVMRVENLTVPARSRVATSALPRLRAYASRDERVEMLKALEDLQKAGVEAELKQAYPLVVLNLSRSEAETDRQKALELLPRALELAPSSMELPEAVLRLRLPQSSHALNPQGELPAVLDNETSATPPTLPTARPDDAAKLARGMIRTLTPRTDRTSGRALAAWNAVLGEALLAQGNRREGLRLLEQAVNLQPGQRLALVTGTGKVVWSSALGPRDASLTLAGQLPLPQKAQQVAALALEQLQFGPQPRASSLLQAAVEAGQPDVRASFSQNIWPVTPSDAPDLQLVDLEGRVYRLGELRGKVVLINLWATWCGPCARELEAFKGLYSRYHEKGLEILAVSVDSDAELVPPYVKKKGLNFPVGFAEQRPSLYRTTNVPVTFLIDKSGGLSFTGVGFSEASFGELEQRIQTLLAAPGSVPQPLLEDTWGADRLSFLAWAPLRRTIDLAMAEGPQGRQLWALQANGDLEILDWPRGSRAQPTGDAPLSLMGAGTRSAYNGFNRLEAVDVDGDRLSDVVVYRQGEGDILVESAQSNLIKLYLPSAEPVVDLRGVDLDEDGLDELVVARSDGTVTAFSPTGVSLWQSKGLMSSDLSVLSSGVGKPAVLVTQEDGLIQRLSADGKGLGTQSGAGSAWRVHPSQQAYKGEATFLVADRGVQGPVEADLDQDGMPEVAVIAQGKLMIFSAQGQLLARLTLTGSRFSLAAGDLNDDQRPELLVSGEGLGVMVIGLQKPT